MSAAENVMLEVSAVTSFPIDPIKADVVSAIAGFVIPSNTTST